MKLIMRVVFSLICVVLPTANCIPDSQKLSGCEDIERISTVLKMELWPKWETLSRERVRQLWFVNLAEENDCQTSSGNEVKCVSLSSRGRFTTWCECCYTFDFDLIHLKDGSYQDQLRSLIIFHTETTLDRTIQAAKQLLSAIRASEDGGDPEVANWELDRNNKITRAIRWQKPVDEKSFIAKAVELQIYQVQSGWTLYITISKESVHLTTLGN